MSFLRFFQLERECELSAQNHEAARKVCAKPAALSIGMIRKTVVNQYHLLILSTLTWNVWNNYRDLGVFIKRFQTSPILSQPYG